MEKKTLILYVPVIHKGYLDFLKTSQNRISDIYLIDGKFLAELSEFEPDIASINTDTVRDLLKSFGFKKISTLSRSNIKEVKNKKIIFVQDEVSRNLYKKYLTGQNVEWVSVFLRWDKARVLTEFPVDDVLISSEPYHIKLMQEAYKEAEKSSDWWRQIGAILVKDKTILFRSYNQDFPSEHTPYQVGEVRDFFKAGERHDLASTIHAEQKIIAEAAKKGISLQGSSLYVTTFPCPVCAKLIACSGIKNLYFGGGGSNFDAKKVLEFARVNIVYVKCNNI